MQPVEGVEREGLAGLQLQLGQQGEVVRGDVWVGAAGDVVVDEPLAVQRSQQAQDAHVGLGEEDVVDHTLQEEEQAALTFKGPTVGKIHFVDFKKKQKNKTIIGPSDWLERL